MDKLYKNITFSNDIMLINEKRLFVYTNGETDNPAILYVHGAPGIGVVDFVAYQADKFKDYYLIAPEQRGVWRSEALNVDEIYNTDQVIEDYEEIRRRLDIEKWSVIAHCMGARTVIAYYAKYPKVIEKIIFENPVLDSLTPMKQLVKLELGIIAKKYGEEKKKELLQLTSHVTNPMELERYCHKLEKLTGVPTNSIMMNKDTITKLSNLKEEYNTELFMKSRKTEIQISRNQEFYVDISDMLDNINVPVMILYGKEDITVPLDMINSMIARIDNITAKEFDKCKHWIHLEQIEQYYECVDNFIKEGDILIK